MLSIARNVRRTSVRRWFSSVMEARIVTKEEPILPDEPSSSSDSGNSFVPVMVEEMLAYLDPKPGQTLLDATFGAGGHSAAVLNHVTDIRLIALDRDPVAVKHAHAYAKKLEKYKEKLRNELIPVQGKFSDLPDLLPSMGIAPLSVDGILLDLGLSRFQLADDSRGFSRSDEAPLDLRMNQEEDESVSAADVVNYLGEQDLAQILQRYGDERAYKKVAQTIVETRNSSGSITKVGQLDCIARTALSRDTIRNMIGKPSRSVTPVFRALQIFVNDELNELARMIEIARWYLKPEVGRLVAITYNALEDTIVKRMFADVRLDEEFHQTLKDKRSDLKSMQDVNSLFEKKWSVLCGHVIVPSASEKQLNPAAFTAKLRVATKASVNYDI